MTPQLQKIRDSLPKYRTLNYKIDRWLQGDDWFYGPREQWEKIPIGMIGLEVRENSFPGRRQYTEDQLDSMAFWKLWGELKPQIDMHNHIHIGTTFEIFQNLRYVEALGGSENIIKQLEKGCGSWV